MIQTAVIVMTILGCSHQEESCVLIPSQEVVWHSYSECEAAIPTSLRSSSKAPYPLITAQCDAKDVVTQLIQTKSVQPMSGLPKAPVTVATKNAQDDTDGKTDAYASIDDERTSISEAIIQQTRSRYVLVRDSASEVLVKLGHGVAGNYTSIYDGIQSSISSSGNVARRTIATIRSNIGAED